jgi:hypothetical protein
LEAFHHAAIALGIEIVTSPAELGAAIRRQQR